MGYEDEPVTSGSGVDDDNDEPNKPPPQPNSPTQSRRDRILLNIAGVAGNALEWFDFACFGYFSDIIAANFFHPEQDGNNALVQSFAVFGVAFLARPVGGAIIGQMGDKVGRKLALETSLLLMAFPTFAIGCLPTFSVAGYGATVLLVICRVAQGLSVGGQVMSSLVFTMEQKPRSQWGFWGSMVKVSSGLGTVAGSLFSYVLRETLTRDQLYSWGWRIPFFFGILGVIPGYYLKKHATEKPLPESEGTNSKTNKEEQREPPRRQKSVIAESLSKKNIRTLISVILVISLPAGSTYIIYVWMTIYMESVLDPPVPHVFAVNTAVGVISLFGMLFGGWLADRIGHYVYLMASSAICIAVATPFLLPLIDRGSAIIAFSVQLTIGFFLIIWEGAALPWIISSFPPSVRLTSVSIGQNVAVCVFGGFTPTLATVLVSRYGIESVGYMVSALAVLALFGILLSLKRTGAAVSTLSASEASHDENTAEVEAGDGVKSIEQTSCVAM